MTRIAVIYYSATGNVHALARAVAEGAGDEGADVRLRHVAELAREMLISYKQRWGRHRSELEDSPTPRSRISSGRTESRSGRRPGSGMSQRS